VHDELLVLIRELRKRTFFAIFLIFIKFLLNSINDELPYTSFGLDLMHRIAFMRKGDDGSALSRRCGMHVIIERKEGG
jgi:hypothetical protein